MSPESEQRLFESLGEIKSTTEHFAKALDGHIKVDEIRFNKIDSAIEEIKTKQWKWIIGLVALSHGLVGGGKTLITKFFSSE